MIHKTTRSILSVLLAALLLVTSTPLTPAFADGGGAVSPQSANSARGGLEQDGDGTYLIYTAENLKEFAAIVNGTHAEVDRNNRANAKLMNDIALSSVCSEEKGTWTPIGTSESTAYTGTFDGNGKTISGLYIDSSADYQGLFGYLSTDGINTGTVKDLSVSGSVKGDNYVGGIVGYNSSGTVTNCAFTGSVSGDWHVGGVVGQNSGTVENCHNIGDVIGSSYVGGVVGYNISSVTNCYNTGSVSGYSNSVGGVVGRNGGNVINCAFSGSVSGNNYVGGVVGRNDGSVKNCYNTSSVKDSGNWGSGNWVGGVVGYNSGTVENCYNTGNVSGSGLYVGGVVGWNSSGSVENCYNTGEVSGTGVGGVVGDNSGTVKNCYNTGDVSGVSGGESVGGVVGLNRGSSSTVENCYNIGKVSGTRNYAGGVVGWNDSGSVKNCYNTGNINGIVWYVGGVVGHNIGSVENCYNTGSVSGNRYVGGVVGWNDSGTVKNCYNTGSVSGSVSGDDILSGSPVGGVVGWNRGSSSTVENCYNIGTVSSNSDTSDVGGVVGLNSGTVTGCYFLKDTAGSGIGNDSSATGAAVVNDLPELCKKFENDTWTISENLNRPVLKDNHEDDGSEQHPYEIFTATQLKNFATAVNGGEKSAHAKLMNNIDLSSVCGPELNNGQPVSWNPIGTNSIDNPYEGTFNGDGHTISGLYINTASYEDQGLFGYVSGTVQNLSVSGSVKGDDYVGGVVGYNSGTFENCAFTGSVSGGLYVGGIVGYNGTVATVSNCYNTGEYNTGEVSGNSYVGGVVGLNSGTVENCYNTGSVSVSGNSVGGVVGLNSGSVTNCYFLQTETVNTKLQGIGENDGSGDATATEKDDTAFHSGEVAWRLQNGQADGSSQVWGQNIKDGKKDDYPQLRAFDADTPQVYKVAFMNGEEYHAEYANNGMTVGSPTTNPTKEGHTFAGWFTETSGGSQWNFNDPVNKSMTLYAQWTAVEEPIPTPTPDPEPSGPSTGDSTGWDDILDELENTAKGDEITIDMGDETKVPAEIFESLAGKDVEISFDLGDIQWSVNGADIPTDTDFTDLDLGASLGTHGIPVNVINTITGEVGTVQITLAHDGEFGFTMTLTAPLGKENAGYWANLYHYDEDAEALNFEAAAKIDEDGSVTIPFSHASQYAIVIDTHSHAAVDVSDIFIDVAPNAWYKDAIQYAYDNGLMTGVSATEFAPEATTTRAMIVSILARLEGVTTAQAAGFADVDDEWYATAVNWAANVGVVNGYEDNTFKPNTAITREQLAAILMNYAACIGQDVSNRADLTSYTDQPSTWAEEAMQWAVAEGLITGVTADTLQPQGAATRAQVAAILQRFLSE